MRGCKVLRNRAKSENKSQKFPYLELKKAVERINCWNAAKLEAQQCRAIVFGTIARRLSNENKIGSEWPSCLWKKFVNGNVWGWKITNHLRSSSITHNRNCCASVATSGNRNFTELRLLDTNIVIAWMIIREGKNGWIIHEIKRITSFFLPCKRLPRKYFDQSVFWSSMTNKVKHRSLLKTWTLETVDAAAETKFAPWSRAAPVKLWTRCNKLSLDFAGLDGAEVPKCDLRLVSLSRQI